MRNLLRFFFKQKYALLLITFFILFILGLIAKTPFKETFEYNTDEGAVLLKSSLLLKGFSLYKEIWYDQPPLFPVILSYWFKLFGPSVYHARVLVLFFSLLLLSAFYFTIKIREGRFCAFMAAIFLLLSTGYLLLSVSVMRGIPALSLAMVSILFLTLYKKLYLNRFLILSGTFMALSLQTKFFGIFLIPIIILEIIHAGKDNPKKRVNHVFSVLLWLITMLFAFLSIHILFFHLDFQMFLQQLFRPHLNSLPFLKNNSSVLWKMLQSDFDIALLALTGIILIIKQRRRGSFFPLIWLAIITVILVEHKPIWYSYYPLISIPACWLGAIAFAKFFSKENLHTRINRMNFSPLIMLPFVILTIFQLPSKYTVTRKSLLGQPSSQERHVLDILSKYKKNSRWMFTDRAIFAFYSDISVPPELVLISTKRILTNNLEPGYLINMLEKYRPELILFTGYLENFPDYYSKIIPYIEKKYGQVYKDEFLSQMPVPPGFLLFWFKEPIGKYLPHQIRFINNKWFYNLIWNSWQIPIPKIHRLPNWGDSKTKIKILVRKDILHSSTVSSVEINKYTGEYEKLIKLYTEYFRLEKDIFKRLSFKLAPGQLLKKGTNLKFTLEDNLNRKWIFKLNGKKNSEKVYHLYKLFGLKTPEAHNISFILNGKQVEGSVQRYVFSETELEKLPLQKLSVESLNYLLKSHVIDWLIKNLDNHVLNYLALSLDETGNIKDLVRIDNDSAFSDKCDLDYDCMLCLSKQNSPYKTAKNWSYFYRLCESYKSKDINLPLEENYAFIKFVADFPEDFFEALILPVKDSSFNELLNTDFDKKKKEYDDFLIPIISRKRNLLADFKKFYSNLASYRKENLEFSFNNSGEQKIIEQISENLARQIDELNKEKLKNNNSPFETTNIEAVVSIEGFSILKSIYLLYWTGEKKDLSRACKEAIDKLMQLDSTAINKNEKLALKYYVEEIKKICAGKNASFALSEINRVVENIFPRE